MSFFLLPGLARAQFVDMTWDSQYVGGWLFAVGLVVAFALGVISGRQR